MENRTAMGFESVVGQDEIIEHLQNSIRHDKVSHAYLFSGQQGSGKKLMANLFAMTLQCEEKGIEPCMKCSSCKKALAKSHPDIITLIRAKQNSIGVDEVREQIVENASIRPYQGPYKIYLISDAQMMTPQAQNALLKTIEEPPAYAMILLMTDNPEALLPTVLSRCVELRLKPVGDRLIREYLKERLHLPEYQAGIQASFAQGSIGKALELSDDEVFSELTQEAVQILKRSKDTAPFEQVERLAALPRDKGEIFKHLELYTLWFRDVLMYKATKEIDGLIFREEIDAIKARAVVSSYEGLQTILDAISTAVARLRANVNFELTMELLFMTMRDY